MQGQSPEELVVGNVAVGRVREHLDLAGLRTQTSNYLESAHEYLVSLLSTLNEQASLLYGEAVLRIDALDITHRLTSGWDLVSSKADYFMTNLRHFDIHVHLSPYMHNFKSFFGNDVSKQAIYFGFAGLVTGGMIGLCIGYTVKQSSLSSSQYFSSPSNGAPNLMKAILCSSSRRGIDGITLSVIPVPRHIGSNEVLVQVKAMGLDNVDFRIAGGYGHLLRNHLGLPSVNEPFVLGRECSGVVLEVGSQVRSYAVSDRVWICLPLWAPIGIMSEFTVVSENYIGHKPRNISFEGAATLPYAALVVWRQILPKSDLGPHSSKSKRVLIHLGCTSKNDGVGLLATQILKSWGARITISTTETGSYLLDGGGDGEEVSGSGVAQMTFLHTLKSLGAETHLILPNDAELLPDLAQRIFDVVVNTDTATVTPLLANFLKDPNGEVIETYPSNLSRKSSWNLIRLILDLSVNLFFKTKEKEEMFESVFEECRRLIESGFVVPVVSRSFLASQYDQAFRHVSNTSNSALAHVGKSVLVFKALPSTP